MPLLYSADITLAGEYGLREAAEELKGMPVSEAVLEMFNAFGKPVATITLEFTCT